MNPLEQHEVLSAITVSLVEALPAGWQRMVVGYAVVDGRDSVGSGVRMADGSHVHVPVPKTLAPHFRRLRDGDDWHRLELIIDPPGAFHVRFHR